MRQNYHVYIASCDPQGGIYHYEMSREGKLTLLDITPMDSPKYMILADDRMYVILRGGDVSGSGLQCFDIDADGKLCNPSAVQSTKGTEGCHIAVSGETVYCANYGSGSIIRMPDRLVCHTGKGVNPDRQEGPHAHYVGLTPDGKYLLAVDLGVDTIFQYDLELNLVTKTKMPDGHGPRHLTFSEDGKYCFVANELISSVTVCTYENERLTVLNTVSTLPADFTGVSYCAAIRYRNGEIFVSNRGHNSIAKMQFADGQLTLDALFDCGGDFPRDMNMIDDLMLCANQLSDDVAVLKETADGAFVQVDRVTVKTPLCVAFR